MLLELLVHVGPMLLGIVLSVLRLDQSTVGHWTRAPYAGLGNYRAGLDPHGAVGADFFHALLRTAGFTAIVVAASWCLGMFAATILNSAFRGRSFFQTFFLVPFALPAYVTGIGWRFILGRDDGALNRLLVDDLRLVHSRPFWLSGGNAFWSTVLVAVWRLWPFAYLMLLAGVQSIPAERRDAAVLDGATAWQEFRSVTLPSVRRLNALVLLVMALWSFNEFTVPFVLFGGQPPPSATLLSNLVYRDAFATFDVGIASALNVTLAVALIIVVVPFVRRARFRERADV